MQRKADEITEKILGKLREHVRFAALRALSQQKNDSSAEIWLERRVFRPAQQIFDRAFVTKNPSLPPPSTRSPQLRAEVTGTWKKAPDFSRSSAPSLPAPPSVKKSVNKTGAVETISPLERVLARPDRASVPAARPQAPPPPGGVPKTGALVNASAAPGAGAASAEPLESLIPPVSSSPEDLDARFRAELAHLRELKTSGEQGGFLLALLLEWAPARLIFLHTIDARSQEATLIAAHAEQASKLAEWKTEPHDPLLTQLRRLRRPVKITAPSTDERCNGARWTISRPEKYLLAIPVLSGHKLVGFIELADPVTGNRFDQDQTNAVLELARAWGERLV